MGGYHTGGCMHGDARSTGGSEDERTTVPRIEAYETRSTTVIFDGENPLAWIASPGAIRLDQYT